MISSTLLAAAPIAPLLLLLVCLWQAGRDRMIGLLWLAPLPALAAALLTAGGSPLVVDRAPVRLTLALDLPGAMLLGGSSLLWIAAGAYAATYLRDRPHLGRFAVFWLLTLTGSIGVFLAADLAGFFLAYCTVSLAAYGLVIHDGTPRSWRAGGIYVTLAVLGETFLLMGFVLLAAATPGERLLIGDAVAALPASPWREVTMALLIAGFGLKAGLVPLHVWMPLSYRAAPIPAAAVLSGAAVKAGVIGLIRFMPLGTALPGWGEALVSAGLLSAFWGVAVGVTQDNPKTVLAYSSISQMGFIATVLGVALASGDSAAAPAVAFYAACHVLVKGGLFLAVGVAAASPRIRPWPVLVPAAVLGLGLAGLPFTGVALAKLAVKSTLGSGWIGAMGSLAAAGTTLLILHFLSRLAATAAAGIRAPSSRGLVWPWLAIALAAVTLPWTLYGAATGNRLVDMLDPAALWGALWPLLIGGFLAVLLRRWRQRVPVVPEGDLIVVIEAAARAATVWGAAVARMEFSLRRWSLASISLLSVGIVLGVAMLVGR